MRAVIVASLALLSGVATAVAGESANVASCRLSAPAHCSVSAHPEAQAQYRERCRQTPEKCTFRPDGTIASWTGWVQPSDPVSEALRDQADIALARLRVLQEAK